MREKKYKKQAFKYLFSYGLGVLEAKKTAYSTLITSRDLKHFENSGTIDDLKEALLTINESAKMIGVQINGNETTRF